MNASRLLVAFRVPAVAVILGVIGWPAAHGQTIYSANILGYVDANFVAGSNLIANPLFAVDNTISNLLRGLPDGSYFLPWDRATQQFGPTNQYTAGAWSSPLATLVAPDGGFLVLPAARNVTFVGQYWGSVLGPRCLTYPRGESVSSWLPQQCCTLDCDVVGPPGSTFSDDDMILSWNRQTQAFDYYFYVGGGWDPYYPQPFAPDEAALFSLGIPFAAKSPFASLILQDVPVPTRVPSATMIQPQRDATNFTFSWASASNTSYAVFCSTNLRVINWRLADHGTATSSNGVCTVSFGSTIPYAFYRLQPDWAAGPLPVLLIGHRDNSSSFRFQFYAPSNATYTVERAVSMSNPTWFSVTNMSAGPSNIVSVVDGSATDGSRYYRVRY